jgi:signal transduction histidine kinase
MTVLRPSSIVARQALASTLVMLVAIAGLDVAATRVVERQLHTNLLATIDTDLTGLTDGMVTGGSAEVSRRIADRTAFAVGPVDSFYWFGDEHGRRIAGNLEQLPPLDAARSEVADSATASGPALLRATRFRGGFTLVVGRSLEPAQAVTRRMSRMFLIAALPAALISLLVGALVARRFGVRVAILNRTFARFEAGERSARTAFTDRDELGALAAHVDDHLAHTERLLTAQREISDNIAHELRTPLTHLDARLLRAIAAGGSPAILQELHDARDDIRSIVSLFDALLDLALAESRDGIGGERMTFDLSERLEDLAELYGASAEEAGLEFSVLIAPAVTMEGEPMAITRAVANLLDNAFKFAPAGAHVRLMVDPGPRIVVEDDGPGIAAADRATIFQRFRRAHAPVKGRGHGLGLALVRVLAARHGLTARFEDALPGARFILAPGDEG